MRFKRLCRSFKKFLSGCEAKVPLGCGKNSMFLSMMPVSFFIK
jgi:hypothetical protein